MTGARTGSRVARFAPPGFALGRRLEGSALAPLRSLRLGVGWPKGTGRRSLRVPWVPPLRSPRGLDGVGTAGPLAAGSFLGGKGSQRVPSKPSALDYGRSLNRM